MPRLHPFPVPFLLLAGAFVSCEASPRQRAAPSLRPDMPPMRTARPAGTGAAPLTAGCTAPDPAGFLMASPMGVTSALSPDILMKPAGIVPGPPPNLPPNLPAPAFDQLVQSLLVGLPQEPTESPLLAMSLGTDVIAVTPTYITQGQFDDHPPSPTGTYPVLELGDHGWYAIEFTVNSSELGSNPDLAPDIGVACERDGSVFAFVLPESAVEFLPPGKDSARVLSPQMLGLPTQDDHLHAMNMHMGIYYTDLAEYDNVFTTRPVPDNPSVFFSLRPEFIAEVGAGVIAEAWGLGNKQEVHGGVIFRTDWQNESWTSPSVYATATSLGLPNADQKDYVFDGLAIDTKNTASPQDDELLFSLRETATVEVPPADQVLHVKPGDPPLRIVIRKSGKYGVLGQQLRAGRGIGDFCTADPWVYAYPELRGAQFLRARPEAAASFQNAPLLVDDFLIARRLNPGVAPQLSVSAFRAVVDSRPVMRLCGSSRLDLPGAKVATIRWSRIADLTRPGQINWHPDHQAEIRYAGRPFTFDVQLPPDGHLGTGTQDRLHAFVMQWSVTADGVTYWSPIAALRY